MSIADVMCLKCIEVAVPYDVPDAFTYANAMTSGSAVLAAITCACVEQMWHAWSAFPHQLLTSQLTQTILQTMALGYRGPPQATCG